MWLLQVLTARVCVCVCVSPHVVVLRFHASVLAAFALHCALTAENSGKPLEKEEQAGREEYTSALRAIIEMSAVVVVAYWANCLFNNN